MERVFFWEDHGLPLLLFVYAVGALAYGVWSFLASRASYRSRLHEAEENSSISQAELLALRSEFRRANRFLAWSHFFFLVTVASVIVRMFR